MVRLFLLGVMLASWCAGGVALGCPLESAGVSVGAATVEVVTVPTVCVSVVGAVLPQAVLVAPSHCRVESFGASAVVTPSALIAARPLAALRARFAPLRTSSRVTVRARVW
jgi:hypothetical protein